MQPVMRDEPLRVRRDVLASPSGAPCTCAARDEPDEVLVPLVSTPRAPAGGTGVPAAADDVELAPEDGLDLRLLGGLVERDRAEHVAVVGHGDGLHARPPATRLTRSLTFTAPSSSEYCEWTWRWTNSADIARYADSGYRRCGQDARQEGAGRTPGRFTAPHAPRPHGR